MKRILSVLFVVALVFSLFSGSIYSERAYAASKISENLVTSSTMSYGNFEIVQFVPQGDGVYTIVVTGSTDNLEHVGLAIW